MTMKNGGGGLKNGPVCTAAGAAVMWHTEYNFSLMEEYEVSIFKKIISVMFSVAIAVGCLGLTRTEASASEAVGQSKGNIVSVTRLGGSDRFDTANKISKEGWKSAETAVLANAYTYADALAGAPLAYAYDAPILLTDGKKTELSVKTELQRLGVKNVLLLGGSAAISKAVEKS